MNHDDTRIAGSPQTIPSTIDLDAIRQRAEAATPGPWAWFGNTDYSYYLATERFGRIYVMTARRKGMQAAEFEFQDGTFDPEVYGSWHGQGTGIQRATDLAVFEVNRQATSPNDPSVYRKDIVGFRSANATFIAHARQDVDDLLALVDALQTQLAAKGGDA